MSWIFVALTRKLEPVLHLPGFPCTSNKSFLHLPSFIYNWNPSLNLTTRLPHLHLATQHITQPTLTVLLQKQNSPAIKRKWEGASPAYSGEAEVVIRRDEEGPEQGTIGQCVQLLRDVYIPTHDGHRSSEPKQPVQDTENTGEHLVITAKYR